MAGVVLSLSQAICRASSTLIPASKCFTTPRFTDFRRFTSTSQPTSVLTTSETIEISDNCVTRLRELGENTSLRVGVEGGGCSGFQYTFELDSPVEDGDRVFRKDGISVVVDESSLQYLKGATVDYHSELIRSAFRIVNNPLAEQGCSCGASFNIKIPK